METTKELVKVVDSSGLELQTSNYIKERFLPFFEQAEDWRSKAESLVVTDASQIEEMKMARTARLALKQIRSSADKTRKELKEDSLRYGKAVQGVYNMIEHLIVPIESHLQEQEDFIEIQEAKRKAELKAKREIELKPFADFVPYGLDLGEISEEDYNKALNGAKLQLQAKIEADKKAEQERIAKQKAEEEERQRVITENARLKAEAQAKEKELAESRAKAEAQRKELEAKARKQKADYDAKLKAEREAKEKLESELKSKIELGVKEQYQVPEVGKKVSDTYTGENPFVDDIEKLAEKYYGVGDYASESKQGFIKGYNKAKETLYTEEQLDKAISWGIINGRRGDVTTSDIDNFIKSLKGGKQ